MAFACTLAVFALTACGGGGSSSSESTAETTTTETETENTEANGGTGAATGSPVKLLVSAPVESLIDFPEIGEGAEAAADYLNKNGGIAGHEVEIINCNNKLEPNASAACAREAVSEGAIATVGEFNTYADETTPVLEAGGVPTVGAYSTGTPSIAESKWSFPLQGGALASYAALPFAAKQEGLKKIASAVTETSGSGTSKEVMEKTSELAGIEYAGTVEIPLQGLPNYAPIAKKLQSLGPPEMVPMSLIPDSGAGIMKAAEALGLETQFAVHPTIFPGSFFSESKSLADGMLISSPFPPLTSSEPFIQEMVKQTEAAGFDPLHDGRGLVWTVGVNSWLAVQGIAKVAESIEGEVTAASLKEALENTEGVDIYGFKWDPAKPGPKEFPRFSSMLEYFLTVKNGKVVETKLKPVDVATELE